MREVASVTEVTEALSRICKACVHLDVAKAKSSLSTYFACQALAGDNVLAVLSGTGADGLLNGIEHDIDGVRVAPNDELTPVAYTQLTLPKILRVSVPEGRAGVDKYADRQLNTVQHTNT